MLTIDNNSLDRLLKISDDKGRANLATNDVKSLRIKDYHTIELTYKKVETDGSCSLLPFSEFCSVDKQARIQPTKNVRDYLNLKKGSMFVADVTTYSDFLKEELKE